MTCMCKYLLSGGCLAYFFGLARPTSIALSEIRIVDNLLITQILPRELPLSNKNNAGQNIQPFTPPPVQYIPKNRKYYLNLLLTNILYSATKLPLKIFLIQQAASRQYPRISWYLQQFGEKSCRWWIISRKTPDMREQKPRSKQIVCPSKQQFFCKWLFFTAGRRYHFSLLCVQLI